MGRRRRDGDDPFLDRIDWILDHLETPPKQRTTMLPTLAGLSTKQAKSWLGGGYPRGDAELTSLTEIDRKATHRWPQDYPPPRGAGPSMRELASDSWRLRGEQEIRVEAADPNQGEPGEPGELPTAKPVAASSSSQPTRSTRPERPRAIARIGGVVALLFAVGLLATVFVYDHHHQPVSGSSKQPGHRASDPSPVRQVAEPRSPTTRWAGAVHRGVRRAGR